MWMLAVLKKRCLDLAVEALLRWLAALAERGLTQIAIQLRMILLALEALEQPFLPEHLKQLFSICDASFLLHAIDPGQAWNPQLISTGRVAVARTASPPQWFVGVT